MRTKILGILAGAIVLLLFGVIISLWPVYKEKLSYERNLAERQRYYESVHQQLLSLQRDIQELEHNKFAIEKIAREKFRLCRDDELVILYTDDVPSEK